MECPKVNPETPRTLNNARTKDVAVQVGPAVLCVATELNMSQLPHMQGPPTLNSRREYLAKRHRFGPPGASSGLSSPGIGGTFAQ